MQIEQDLRGRCGQLMASELDSEFRGLGSRSCRVILLCSWANRVTWVLAKFQEV